jgi:hypothetical protein
MNVEIGVGLSPRYSFPGIICFKFSAFCLCSVVLQYTGKNMRKRDEKLKEAGPGCHMSVTLTDKTWTIELTLLEF